MKNGSAAEQIARTRAFGNPFQITVYRSCVDMFGKVMKNTEQKIGQFTAVEEIEDAVLQNLRAETQHIKAVTDVHVRKKSKLLDTQYKVRIRTQNGPTLYYRYNVSIKYC